MLQQILDGFPKLKNDPHFKITSRQDIKYNCIAWAAVYSDRWLWPPGEGYGLDGVNYVWPSGVPINELIDSFVKMFEAIGYSICADDELEQGFRKIALYKDSQNNCTHASRQKSDGLWTSKLGQEHDISHSNPNSIESDAYGIVACLMKKKII